jgi:lipid II:glycine glycyltransferase (peptidoglycan interpeptide bridge formation enzyme)
MGKSFLQSEEWADFQKRLGRNVLQIDGVNIIEHELPTNRTYFYSPRPNLPENIDDFLSKLKKIAKQRNAIFFKIDPLNSLELGNYGFVRSNNIQPLKTIILDLTKSEEELLSQMHPKMRYNINLAQKKGITIRRAHDDDDFVSFWRLVLETAKRDKFKTYSRSYYEQMLETVGIELFIAEYKNDVIAGNIVVFYENQAIYLHGASSYEHRNLMAAPLLQWHQILEAKKLGYTEYDFWGIDEIKWPGVTRFKRGFGGKEITYSGAYDLVLKPIWYKIYKLAKKLL